MGICYSLPDAAADKARTLATAAGTQWSNGLGASSAAAAKAARKAKLTKYALVKCEFDAETAAKAKRLSVIREMLFEQIALWKAWSAGTLPLDYSVLMHWSKHCHANEECSKRLRNVALQVQNASAAHAEYVKFMTETFIEGIDETIDVIEEAWNVYELYEKSEYDYRFALKTSKDEEKNAIKKGEMEIKLQEAKKAINECAGKVESILVPLFKRTITELENFAKKCMQKRERTGEEAIATAAKFERANSVAYAKLKKRTYTAADAITAAKNAIVDNGLPEQLNEINTKLDEMKRHGMALALIFQDFVPYIKLIFGPDRMNVFADELCKKIDGFKSLKKAAAEIHDKIQALTSEIDVEEFKRMVEEFEQVVHTECNTVSSHSTAYVKSLSDIAKAERALERAENVYKSKAPNFVMPPIGDKLAKFNDDKAAWNGALKDAQDAVTIAKERSVADLNAHKESFDNLFIKKDSTFHSFIIVAIENACAIVTEAHKTITAVKARHIRDAAEEPEAEEVIEVPEVDFSQADASQKEAEVSKAEAEAKMKEAEEAEVKAKEAAEAAEKARQDAIREENEAKKEELLRKAAEEAKKAAEEAEAKQEAEAKAKEAAKIQAEKEAKAEKEVAKAAKALEQQVSIAEKKAEKEASNAASQQDAVDAVRDATIKETLARASSVKEVSIANAEASIGTEL